MGEAAWQVLIQKADASFVHDIYEIGKLCFSDAWREETVAHDMEGDHSEYFIALVDGKTAGYGCYWFIMDEGQLLNIGVRPEYRKKGIGALLLEAGLEEAVKRRMSSLFLEVRVSNEEARRLYKKYGFRMLGTRKGVYDLPREDGYIMSKELRKH
ncbi:ribosomal protein S18-alanine N-acetyltransferase [uncultured Dialister sp.]|uniref:ribosomal protein S18-alanine N-acetyltransferase n=1 Tax=uncultured Dialister sp. TaxID=278064 RepID=UPI0025CFEF5C|nr:ribosomal protein S18-alanine N-acetyltransferase [uncultured Dialister sp.]